MTAINERGLHQSPSFNNMFGQIRGKAVKQMKMDKCNDVKVPRQQSMRFESWNKAHTDSGPDRGPYNL